MALLSSKALGTLIRVQESGVDVNYEIAGFNIHKADSATLVRKDVMPDATVFGSNNTYFGSTMDTLCNETVYASYPLGLQAMIQPVNIICYPGLIEERKCFALSYTEVGIGVNSGISENAALPLYSSAAARIKRDNGVAALYWLRSRNTTTNVYLINTSGNTGSLPPSNSMSFVPAFVIMSDAKVSDVANGDGSYTLIWPTKIEVEAKMAEYDVKPTATRAMLSHNGVLDTLELCNNYNDVSPVWETATVDTEHVFANASKTAEKWAVGIHVITEREGTEQLYLNEPVVLVR
ncbi:MAG: DUF6273 domain-containing protein [Candidatus Pelethousia sp.]|nr:DUF6273 domain-containing protein [Candidatus Pelethousia sp.]